VTDLWSAETRIGHLRFQARGRGKRPNLALVYLGLLYIVVYFVTNACLLCRACVFQYLANRLAGKNVSEMTYFMLDYSGGTLAQSVDSETVELYNVTSCRRETWNRSGRGVSSWRSRSSTTTKLSFQTKPNSSSCHLAATQSSNVSWSLSSALQSHTGVVAEMSVARSVWWMVHWMLSGGL